MLIEFQPNSSNGSSLKG